MTGLAWERVITDEGRAALLRVAEAAERAADASSRLARATDELTQADNHRTYHSDDARCTCESCPIHGDPDAA